MLRVAVVTLVISACACLCAYRVTTRTAKQPWNYTATAFEHACHWVLAPGMLLMDAVLPHHPLDSPEATPPSPLIIPAAVVVSIVCWAALLAFL